MDANPPYSCHEEDKNNSIRKTRSDTFLIQNIIYTNETEPLDLSIKDQSLSDRTKEKDRFEGFTSESSKLNSCEKQNSFENGSSSSDKITGSDQLEDELKIYEENDVMHIFQSKGLSNSEIYYCNCCDKIMKGGIIYGSNTIESKSQHRSSRARFSDEQIKALKQEFKKNEKIDKTQRAKLSEMLEIPEKQIMFWWQNERARSKRKKL